MSSVAPSSPMKVATTIQKAAVMQKARAVS
jgi:hypothetical protein